ncbi:MAG TPA: HAD-IIIA family hydrolase [Steroidobacteraceae bacterium]|jgi:3-deoxy-D-manno-octulosonate 8-phosphate phosphatase (KDO 8-P phosphatase)|nr:HAD-IIIA family hydrolase [Steroidobacteraceae bacterium]
MRSAIRLLVLDVDGVLTDGRLYFGARGEALKVFDVHDGLGLMQLLRSGINVAVLSRRRSPMVTMRCRELGVRHVYQGVTDKLGVFARLCARLRLTPAVCAVVGDDLPDVPLMRAAALSFAVADAHREVRRVADIVTRLPGGRGAVREVCDHLLALRARKARVR